MRTDDDGGVQLRSIMEIQFKVKKKISTHQFFNNEVIKVNWSYIQRTEILKISHCILHTAKLVEM